MKSHIYLNNAATSFPKPSSVVELIERILHAVPFHHARSGFGLEGGDYVASTRASLATLFNAPHPDHISFSSGATESLNVLLNGLTLPGMHVITTATEHNSVLRPLKTMERQKRLSLSIIPCDTAGAIAPETIRSAFCKETGLVVVNHCSNVTGIVNDIAAIGHETRKRGISFIVDASQSAGAYPIDVQAMNIDALAFAGHKSLYGMQGVGGMYLHGDRVVPPFKIGGTGTRSDYLYQPESLPVRYEAGTQNIPGIASLHAGIAHIIETGIDTIRQRKQACVQRIREALCDDPRIRMFPGTECAQQTTVFCFTIENTDPADIGYLLQEQFGIICRSGLHCAPLIHEHLGTYPQGSVRISPSHFTSDNDIELCIGAIREIASMEADGL